MSDKDEAFELPRFQAKIDQLTYREAGLTPDTHQRYKKGRVPAVFLRLLKRRPDLAKELCADLSEHHQGAA